MTQAAVAYCFDCLFQAFDKNAPVIPPQTTPTEKYPMFITWKKQDGDEKSWRLRGCIGTFGAQDLVTGLKKYAHTSAFKDSRFKPISTSEVPLLSCKVSFLVKFEAGKDCYDWVVGLHGIQIDFTDSKGGSYSATYLPEVAAEQGWNQKESIVELVAKSGYTGPVTAQLCARIKLTRYQSLHAGLTYSEYTTLRKLKN